MDFENACKSWRLDLARAALALSIFGFGENDFQPGGSYHQEFMDTANHIKAQLANTNEEMVCDMAEMMFGPSGRVIKNWMKKR
jgi:hypothetical protein